MDCKGWEVYNKKWKVYVSVGHRSFLLTSNQLRKRKTMTQDEDTRSPHQMLFVSARPQPRSMMSRMAWTVIV